MTDPAELIADVLADHQSISDGHLTTECWCGKTEVRGNGIEWANHVAAEVVAALQFTPKIRNSSPPGTDGWIAEQCYQTPWLEVARYQARQPGSTPWREVNP